MHATCWAPRSSSVPTEAGQQHFSHQPWAWQRFLLMHPLPASVSCWDELLHWVFPAHHTPPLASLGVELAALPRLISL